MIMLDPKNQSVGLLHAVLPDSSINRRIILEKPGMFIDTGIPILINKMMALGYDGKSHMVIKIAGAASVADPNQTFNIGNKNVIAAKKTLSAHRMIITAEDVGGTINRTVTIGLDNDKVVVSSPGREPWNL